MIQMNLHIVDPAAFGRDTLTTKSFNPNPVVPEMPSYAYWGPRWRAWMRARDAVNRTERLVWAATEASEARRLALEVERLRGECLAMEWADRLTGGPGPVRGLP